MLEVHYNNPDGITGTLRTRALMLALFNQSIKNEYIDYSGAKQKTVCGHFTHC